jgi:ABC-type multidrug transport system ATPase subunit
VITVPAVQRANVFLAYSRADQRPASDLIAALQKHEISVWWDVASIPIGVDWEQFLTDQVSAAQCVVALWSPASLESKWVRFEAEFAARRGVLLPVLIAKVEIPPPFNRFQAASLVNWDGDPSDPDFERLLAAVHRMIETAPAVPNDLREYKASQRSAERRAELLFQQNLRIETTIEYIELQGAPFDDQLRWNVAPGVNVLLGRNGYGKTLLLRSVLALLQYDDKAAVQTVNSGSATISLLRNGSEESIQFSDEYFEEDRAVGKLPVLAIPDTRFINRSVTTLSAVADETTGSSDRAELARFGAWHFLEERPYEGMIQTFLYGLCLDYFEHGLSFRGEQFALVQDVVRELTDKSFEFDRVAREGRDRFTLYVRTEGNEGNPLPIQKCSQGTSSVIAMFGLIYDYLKSLRYEAAPDVTQRCGIVVIDEVDAHLHPVWQQKIVTLLRDRFPNVQFVLTAHNPIVVAGCGEDEVCVLRKNPEKGFSLTQFPNHFIGWQTEEIYRKVFEIEGPDTSFTRLDAMRPFKDVLRKEAAMLARQERRSSEEERSLRALEEQLLHIENVEQSRAGRITNEELVRENKTLSDRLMGLESARAAAVNAQTHVDNLRLALAAEQRRSAQYRRIIVVCMAILTVATVAALGYVLR